MKTKTVTLIISLASMALLNGCGGGGGSSDGAIVHGSLTQLSTGAHGTEASTVQVRHSAGEQIDGVKICLLGECSVTDSSGEWGVNVPTVPAGSILVTLNGHGIDSSTVINVPADAKDVSVDLGNSATGVVVTALVVDGVDHTEHDHDHAE